VDQWNRLASSAAVDPEICDISRNHRKLRMHFAEANQAQVRQIGRSVGISRCQLRESGDLISQHERWTHKPFLYKSHDETRIPKMESRFSKDGIAG